MKKQSYTMHLGKKMIARFFVAVGYMSIFTFTALAVGVGGNTSGTVGDNTSGICPQGVLCNPLQSKTIQELLIKIIDILLTFAIPIIVLFIMYAGYLFVTARGNEGKITEARSALTWSVIGGVIILSAKLIIQVIEGTVKVL